QYTSDAYQKTLRTLGIMCSMSRRGNCYDNAVMERFFWSLNDAYSYCPCCRGSFGRDRGHRSSSPSLWTAI
ncbi:MAG: DDE-type integrase/transposase/recombinase, partial [Planctomycetes bacterium]|nr:DDE-type integrase/transposase/recombinase [Planctomycetota bacterium]